MSRKSVMTHQFSQVPSSNIQRSSFDRSHGYKTTFDGGWLVPIFIDEALPADTFNLRMTAFARMATPIYPIMDNLRMETFFFSVPLRLLWENWQRFNGEQENPTDTTDYIMPEITSPAPTTGDPVGGWKEGTLEDYFGLPLNKPHVKIQSMFHRAYNLVWNEWFRDQNLQDSVQVNRWDDGPDLQSHYKLLRRGKRHDYFTSSLPWPQKGDSIDLPLGDRAPITGIATSTLHQFETGSHQAIETGGQTVFYPHWAHNQDSATYAYQNQRPIVFKGTDAGLSGELDIWADLSQASAATINQLRQAFQIQKLMEKDARGGTRYTEIIRSHFGVISPDARLQRPEYLGGGSSPIIMNPIAQTTSTDATSPQGNLAAMATATLNNHGFNKSFTEHCIIIGLVNVRADLTYQQGLDRMFTRSTRYDYYWPSLAHIGEQAVLNKELVCTGQPIDEEVFGYQERYAEYRYKQSKITGKFRSGAAQSLDAWHLSQELEGTPTLSPEFIEEHPPIDRVIAVPSEPQFIFDAYFNMRSVRPMPLFGVPGLIDHF